MTRYKQPFGGEIFINDLNIVELDLPSFRDKIALLSQEVVIFNASLRDNLTWFNNIKVSDKEIYSIMEKLNLIHLIDDKSFTLESVISDISETISGGEKQRIALARCLLCNQK